MQNQGGGGYFVLVEKSGAVMWNSLPDNVKDINSESTFRTALKTFRPVARIFRRGVTWMSDLHKHARLGGSGGMLPQKIFRN